MRAGAQSLTDGRTRSESGAGQRTAMQGLSTPGQSYQHWEGFFDSTTLASAVGYQGQILCPQSNLCGQDCRGFCSCTAPGTNTCVCPTCVAAKCQVSRCDNAVVGCSSSPTVCDDNNRCTTDSCNPSTGLCEFPAVPVGNATCATCVPSVGCLPPTGVSCDAKTPCVANQCYGFTCVANKCVPDPATSKTCTDTNACTADSCDPVLGCQFNPIPNVCTQVSTCFTTVCVPGPGTQPNCQTGTTSKTCAGERAAPKREGFSVALIFSRPDTDSCTNDLCREGTGCVNVNRTCPASDVPCSFPEACVGTGPAPQCIIANYSCGFSAETIAGISAGVIAGVVIGVVLALLIIAFLSKKGYDHFAARTALASTSAYNNAAYTANANEGEMPYTTLQDI